MRGLVGGSTVVILDFFDLITKLQSAVHPKYTTNAHSDPEFKI